MASARPIRRTRTARAPHVRPRSRADVPRFTEAASLYGIPNWGKGFFHVSDEGDLVVRDLLLNGLVPDLQELDRYAGSFAIYKLGQDVFEFLKERYGEERVVELLESEWKYRNFSTAFYKIYGLRLWEANEEWKQHLRERYFPELAGERPAGTTATAVVTKGRLNFTPTIIPAGILLTLGVVSSLDNVSGVETGGLFFLGLGLTFVLVAALPGHKSERSWAWIPGVALLLFGALLGTPYRGLSEYLWPAVLIVLGGYLVFRFYTNRSAR